MDKRSVDRMQFEFTIIEHFDDYVFNITNQHIIDNGVEHFNPILFVLLKDGNKYRSESLNIPFQFIDNIIYGYQESVMAYSFVHKSYIEKTPTDFIKNAKEITDDDIEFNNDVDINIVMYYENMIIKKTSYFLVGKGDKQFNGLTKKPQHTSCNESHPAAINMSSVFNLN